MKRAMKVVLFGGTGPTGLLILEKALAAGHEVTVVARTPGKVGSEHERLTVVKGDIFDADSFAEAVSGSDAVISCVGSSSIRPPITIYSQGTRNILNAMEAGGVRRLVAVTSGALKVGRDPNYPLFFELIMKPLFLRHVYDDMRAMEELVMQSGLDWTLIRPSRLSDEAATEPLREVKGAFSMKGGFWTPRDGLARSVVDKLTDPSSVRQAVAVAK